MGSENNVHPRILRFNRIDDIFLLHHTAADADQKIRIFFLAALQLAEGSEKPLVCIFSDTASIDNCNIRIFSFFYGG